MFSKTKIFTSTGNSSGTDKNTKERTLAGRLGEPACRVGRGCDRSRCGAFRLGRDDLHR